MRRARLLLVLCMEVKWPSDRARRIQGCICMRLSASVENNHRSFGEEEEGGSVNIGKRLGVVRLFFFQWVKCNYKDLIPMYFLPVDNCSSSHHLFILNQFYVEGRGKTDVESVDC